MTETLPTIRRGLSVALTALLLTAAAASAHAAPKEYGLEELPKVADELARKREMPADKRTELIGQLRKLLRTKEMRKMLSAQPAHGVLAFRSGEGGLIVKFMHGEGYVSFKGGRQAGAIELKSWSAGAQVGGSATWGIGLVMGLTDEAHFGGEYEGQVRSATAGDVTTTAGATVVSVDEGEGATAHSIYLITSARGLSAGVGGQKLSITPTW